VKEEGEAAFGLDGEKVFFPPENRLKAEFFLRKKRIISAGKKRNGNLLEFVCR
jgi:hypothetical protein